MKPLNGSIPLPPVTAKRTNLVCHHCIVGCGYNVYRWPEGTEGGPAPDQNALGLDFRHQLPPLSGAPAASMCSTIADSAGGSSHVMVVPDRQCVVNEGLYSTRGGQHGSVLYAPDAPTSSRLHEPRVVYDEHFVDVAWERAFDLYAQVATRALDADGPDSLLFNCFDHGGGGGGFENTWGTGKLMFSALRTKMVRIHNRPAYNSECHASRDMGIGELNNSYEDSQLADTVIVAGANPYETQTNYFLVHLLPNLQGRTLEKKRKFFKNEPVEAAKIIIVDPRRTATVAICEKVVGPERVLHLDIAPGTDTALYNAMLTYAVEQGWHDESFIKESTQGFGEAVSANKTTIEECSRITGISPERIRQAAQWAYSPKSGGARRRTLHAYEKGVIWGNDNYRTQSSLVNVALATHNVGRRGTGVVRLGGHQEGYARPPYPGGRPAFNVDEAVINGKGRMLTVWGTNPFQSTLNATAFEKAVRERGQIVAEAIRRHRRDDMQTLAAAIHEATDNGGLFVTTVDLYLTRTAEASHLVLPAAQPGEINLTSMNGERRLRLTEKFMDPPGSAKADCLIAAGIANRMKKIYEDKKDADMVRRFSGFDWKTEEDAFEDGFRKPSGIDSQGGATGHLATYERLRKAGTNGVQLPIREYRKGRLIGTEMLYTDGRFDTDNGKAKFLPSPWKGLLPQVQAQKDKYRFWINNGRVNHIWQTGYHDRLLAFRSERYPLPPVEMNPKDAKELGVEAGDMLEIFNDYGSFLGIAYPDTGIKRGQVFAQFGHYASAVGRLVTDAVDRNLVPYYKGTWADIRKVDGGPDYAAAITFKSRRYGS